MKGWLVNSWLLNGLSSWEVLLVEMSVACFGSLRYLIYVVLMCRSDVVFRVGEHSGLMFCMKSRSLV